jgi:hypothetical protein
MSGGSNDDACLAVAHKVGKKIIVDLVVSQVGRPPFDPRAAIKKRFVPLLREFDARRVAGDDYAGETFKFDFAAEGISYRSCPLSASDLYEHLEPKLNAGEIELPDVPKLQEQLLTLVMKGAKVTHQTGDHDDFAASCAGAVWAASAKLGFKITEEAKQWARMPYRRGTTQQPSSRGRSRSAPLAVSWPTK